MTSDRSVVCTVSPLLLFRGLRVRRWIACVSGCLPLLVHLLHPNDMAHDPSAADADAIDPYSVGERQTRERAAAALRNIVLAHRDDPRGRQEVRVLRLLEQVRMYCDQSRHFQLNTSAPDVDDSEFSVFVFIRYALFCLNT